MKLARVFILVASALATLTVSSAGAAAAQTFAGHYFGGHRFSPVIGQVYVNDNTTPVNTIAAFNRHADGSLSSLPGSPFSIGGAGTGTGIGSQGALQESADGRYLLAVDAGSSQISVVRIRPDGGLSPVPGGPVSSDGNEPVSIAINRGLVYVANAGAGASNYTGFTLDFAGRLRALAGSTFTLPEGSTPGDVLFNRWGTSLIGVRVATSEIDSFTVGPEGLLTPAPESPLAAQGPGPFGSEFSPVNPTQLFVSNAHGGTEAGSVSAFSVAPNGALSSIGSSPFKDSQTAPCWVEISHDGRYLFAVNTVSGSISRYAIAWNGSLELLGSTLLKASTGKPEDARLDPDGDTLWVLEAGGLEVAGLAVHDGELSELASSPAPLPAGAAPFGIVVN